MLTDCSKCSTKMKISICRQQSVANIILKDTEGKDYHLTVFDEVLKQLTDLGKASAGDNSSIYEQLLYAPQLQYTISQRRYCF